MADCFKKFCLKNEEKNFKIDENFTCLSALKSVDVKVSNKKKEVDEKAEFFALANFDPQSLDEIHLVQNDSLVLIKNYNNSISLVKNLRTQHVGFVPTYYICKADDIENEEWFWSNVSKETCENYLKNPKNNSGVFIIRKSDKASFKKNPNHFFTLCVSIRCDIEDDKLEIKNYQLFKLNTGEYFVNSSKKFNSLNELIEFYKTSKQLSYKKNEVHYKFKLSQHIPKPNYPEDKWEVSRDSLRDIKKLGKGNFGEVWHSKWTTKIGVFDVAVKKLFKLDEEERRKQFEEANMMKQFKHDKIVKLWCLCTIGEPFMIILEYMIHGSLRDYMRKGNGKYLNFVDIINIAAQIADGMRYLASQNYVHRDLAARNILIGENNNIKISDFGLTKPAFKKQNGSKIRIRSEDFLTFPVKWTAPELFYFSREENSKIYENCTSKADVWSFGIVLYEIVTLGREPYEDLKNNEKDAIKMRVKNGGIMPKPTGLCTDPYYEKMKKCWSLNPDERDTFETLYNFFSDYFISIEPHYVA